ncbi:MAG TPA: hypothetical protein VIW07_18015 [Candidatus Udaeobacter sp.]|jgi:hypothetical protein
MRKTVRRKKKTFAKAAYAGLDGHEVHTKPRSLDDVVIFVRQVNEAKRRAKKSALAFG